MFQEEKIHFIAHRGDSGFAPENTLSAIKQAIANKSDYAEFDVRLSKDGIPIVIHDATLRRITQFKKLASVARLSLKKLKEYDVGSWFHPSFSQEKIPTFEEILKLDWGQTGLMIEIKKSKASSTMLINALIKSMSEVKNPPKIVIGSFCLDTVSEVKQRLGEFPVNTKTIGILDKKNMISPFLNCQVDYLAISQKLAKPSTLKLIPREKTKVWVFTVNEINHAEEMIKLKVDGIISNYANALKKTLMK